MNSQLRPDERAAQASIGRANNAKNQLAGAAIAIAGGGLASKIIPFLSEYVPVNLAMKGISKVAPKIGQFLEQGQAMGLTAESGIEFLKGEIGKEGKQEPAKQNGNIIEQYSPNLFQYMKDLIGKGSSPIDAAAKARKFLDKKEQDIIAKMEKDHKTDWSSIVESVFGGQGMAQPQQPQQEQQQGQQTNQGGQGGPGSQKLMDIMNQINQKLGQ